MRQPNSLVSSVHRLYGDEAQRLCCEHSFSQESKELLLAVQAVARGGTKAKKEEEGIKTVISHLSKIEDVSVKMVEMFKPGGETPYHVHTTVISGVKKALVGLFLQKNSKLLVAYTETGRWQKQVLERACVLAEPERCDETLLKKKDKRVYKPA